MWLTWIMRDGKVICVCTSWGKRSCQAGASSGQWGMKAGEWRARSRSAHVQMFLYQDGKEAFSLFWQECWDLIRAVKTFNAFQRKVNKNVEKWDDCLGHDGNSSVWCLAKFLKHGICRRGVRSVMGFIMLLITKIINTHSSRFNKELQKEKLLSMK